MGNARAQAQRPPPPCDSAVPAPAELVALSAAIRVGRREPFGLEQTFSSDWDARLPIDVHTVDAAGKPFFRGRLRRFGDRRLYMMLELGNRPVEIRASYVEELPEGPCLYPRRLTAGGWDRQRLLP
jgi:hypothetical protein